MIPNAAEVAKMEDPPKLNSGNGSPVNGIKPKTVNTFMKIWIKNNIIKPDNKNFSNT